MIGAIAMIPDDKVRCVVHLVFDGDENRLMAVNVMDALESCLESHVRTAADDVRAREAEVDRLFSETIGPVEWAEVSVDEQNEDDAQLNLPTDRHATAT